MKIFQQTNNREKNSVSRTLWYVLNDQFLTKVFGRRNLCEDIYFTNRQIQRQITKICAQTLKWTMVYVSNYFILCISTWNWFFYKKLFYICKLAEKIYLLDICPKHNLNRREVNNSPNSCSWRFIDIQWLPYLSLVLTRCNLRYCRHWPLYTKKMYLGLPLSSTYSCTFIS